MLTQRDGFTLIELLIVIVIIGILAAIAIPKFGETREAAYYAAMQTDLKNLNTAQELYYQTDYTYGDDPGILTAFQASKGVNVAVNPSGSGQGWSATATHDALPSGEGCVIYVGDASAPGDFGVTDVEKTGIPFCSN